MRGLCEGNVPLRRRGKRKLTQRRRRLLDLSERSVQQPDRTGLRDGLRGLPRGQVSFGGQRGGARGALGLHAVPCGQVPGRVGARGLQSLPRRQRGRRRSRRVVSAGLGRGVRLLPDDVRGTIWALRQRYRPGSWRGRQSGCSAGVGARHLRRRSGGHSGLLREVRRGLRRVRRRRNCSGFRRQHSESFRGDGF